MKSYGRAYQAANLERRLLLENRRRARQLGATIGKITVADRRTVLAANDGRCVYCNARAATTIDHVVPLARGGAHALPNLAGACGPCNSSKGDWLLSEWQVGGGAQAPQLAPVGRIPVPGLA